MDAGVVVLIVLAVPFALGGLLYLFATISMRRSSTAAQRAEWHYADKMAEAAKPTFREQRALDRDAKREAEARIICPHCGERGHVTTRMVQRKHGISGGKATAGILTGGVSLLAVGLSRKGWTTVLSCSNCRMNWDVAT